MLKSPKWLTESKKKTPGKYSTWHVKYTKTFVITRGTYEGEWDYFRSWYYVPATSKKHATLLAQQWGVPYQVRKLKQEVQLERLWVFDSDLYLKFWTQDISSDDLVDITHRYRIYKRSIKKHGTKKEPTPR